MRQHCSVHLHTHEHNAQPDAAELLSAAPHVMRILAGILSVIGLLLLFLFADLRWGFVPLHLVGLESGLSVASMACCAGLAV